MALTAVCNTYRTRPLQPARPHAGSIPALLPQWLGCRAPQVALRWFCSRSLLRHEGITKELIDRIPGKQTDRKTPLGELNWVRGGAPQPARFALTLASSPASGTWAA